MHERGRAVQLTTRQDRIAGTLLGLAAGDALGAGYEFGPPLPEDTPIVMTGGGSFGWEPGEWTDDTGMAVGIAFAMRSARSRGAAIADERLFDDIVAHWGRWAGETKDIGSQTSTIFGAAGVGRAQGPSAARLRTEARAFHERTGRSAGNGSLMRTAPVALFTLDQSPDDVAALAAAIGELTHVERTAGEACVLWSLAVRHAIETGLMDIRIGLPLLEDSRQDHWRGLITLSESLQPRDFRRNGWVVEAFQAAWSAIATTRGSGQRGAVHLVGALEAAVRGGRDTDTVAAIAGSLLGAAYGATAIPERWRAILHGWPGIDASDLATLALDVAPS
jgi:ADP-ribosylglycohydrolase